MLLKFNDKYDAIKIKVIKDDRILVTSKPSGKNITLLSAHMPGLRNYLQKIDMIHSKRLRQGTSL